MGCWLVWQLWATSLIVVHGVAMYRSRRVPRHNLLHPTTPYTVVRPCAGKDGHLLNTLLSVARMPSVQMASIVHLVPFDDPARPVVTQATAMLRQAGLSASIQLTEPGPIGSNPKVAQLCQMRPASPTVIYLDSHVDASRVPVAALLGALRLPHLGASWAPTHEAALPPRACWASRTRAAVTCSSLHAFIILGQLDPRLLAGAVLALRADALRAIGNWTALLHTLGEDMALPPLLAGHGLQVHMVQASVPLRLPAPRQLRDVVQRYARWVAVIRAQRPALLLSYPLLFFATPLLGVALCWAPCSGAAGATWMALLLLSRLGVALAAERHCGIQAPKGAVGLRALLADGCLLLGFFAGLRRTLTWRHRRLRLGRGGRLLPLADEPRA